MEQHDCHKFSIGSIKCRQLRIGRVNCEVARTRRIIRKSNLYNALGSVPVVGEPFEEEVTNTWLTSIG